MRAPPQLSISLSRLVLGYSQTTLGVLKRFSALGQHRIREECLGDSIWPICSLGGRGTWHIVWSTTEGTIDDGDWMHLPHALQPCNFPGTAYRIFGRKWITYAAWKRGWQLVFSHQLTMNMVQSHYPRFDRTSSSSNDHCKGLMSTKRISKIL